VEALERITVCAIVATVKEPITGIQSRQLGAATRVLTFALHPIVQVSAEVSSEMTKDGVEEEDYFVHFEDLKFTEEDLAHIDRIWEGGPHSLLLEPVPLLPELEGKALVTIEVEQELQPVPKVISPPNLPSRTPMSKPPYDAFRSGKSLSVSDLTGPLW
jgi:hypothetical protein